MSLRNKREQGRSQVDACRSVSKGNDLMQRKPNLYLETSIIGMYFQENAPYLKNLTRKFWEEELPHFNGYVSEIILDEIRGAREPKLRIAFEDLIREIHVLEITEEVIRLGDV
jgi:hypothetical protein